MKNTAVLLHCGSINVMLMIIRSLSSFTLTLHSLVPRPFPPPVFDHILHAKTEGEGLGERVTCVTSERREGRREGGCA